MTNPYFASYSSLPRFQNARAEAVNAIIDAIIVGFDNVPSALSIANAAAIAAGVLATVAQWAVGAGLVNATTGAYPTAVTSLTDGLLLGFRANLANTSTTPTFKPDAMTARTITRNGGQAIVIGDIRANGEYLLRYNLANTRWELLNPSLAPRNAYTNFGAMTAYANSNNANYCYGGYGSSWAVTPASTGKIRVRISGTLTESNVAGGAEIKGIAYGTGAAPAQGANSNAATLANSNSWIFTPLVAGAQTSFSVEAEITGLTVGTAYWFDVSFGAISVGTATFKPSSVVIEEITGP